RSTRRPVRWWTPRRSPLPRTCCRAFSAAWTRRARAWRTAGSRSTAPRSASTLLEGKGARTGLITTEGFRDVLEIGRGNFLRMYDVLYRRPTPLVPRGRCLEVPERLGARGDVLVPLDEAAVRAAARRLAHDGVRAVALTFLFSYRNPAHEQRAAEILAEELPDAAISVSHRLTQEWREYERT